MFVFRKEFCEIFLYFKYRTDWKKFLRKNGKFVSRFLFIQTRTRSLDDLIRFLLSRKAKKKNKPSLSFSVLTFPLDYFLY